MSRNSWGIFIFVGLSVIFLAVSAILDYRFFTTFSELISIFLGLTIFVIAYYSKEYTKGSNLLYVGIAFFSVSIIDLMHLINGGGMSNIVKDINSQDQLWIAARAIEAFILYYAFSKANWKRVFDFNFLLVSFAVTTFLVLLGVSLSEYLPKLYTVENGYNLYKYSLDIAIIIVFIIAIITINKNENRDYNKKILTIAILLKIAAEIVFIFETGGSGVLEATRYILKYISYVFLFLVFAKELLQRPYDSIFRAFKDKEEKLIDLAKKDSLTGMYNHSTSYEVIKDIIMKNEKIKKDLCLMMIDIDDFKSINDKNGHVKGDEILVKIGDIFKTCDGPIGVAGRYGGDEFIVLLVDCDSEHAKLIKSKLFLKMKRLSLEVGLKVTLSIGIAEWEEGFTAKDLVRNADYEMYQAKSTGKNTFSLKEKSD